MPGESGSPAPEVEEGNIDAANLKVVESML